MQTAMLNQPASDASTNLLNQLGPYFPKPTPGLPPAAPWEGAMPPAGPSGAFPTNPALPAVGLNDAALTGAASGLQAAAQSLLRQRMEALRQQGAGLRGFVPPPARWEPEVPFVCSVTCLGSAFYRSECYVRSVKLHPSGLPIWGKQSSSGLRLESMCSPQACRCGVLFLSEQSNCFTTMISYHGYVRDCKIGVYSQSKITVITILTSTRSCSYRGLPDMWLAVCTVTMSDNPFWHLRMVLGLSLAWQRVCS